MLLRLPLPDALALAHQVLGSLLLFGSLPGPGPAPAVPLRLRLLTPMPLLTQHPAASLRSALQRPTRAARDVAQPRAHRADVVDVRLRLSRNGNLIMIMIMIMIFTRGVRGPVPIRV